jgi:thiol-disulfide isomerase/thioredoxin
MFDTRLRLFGIGWLVVAMAIVGTLSVAEEERRDLYVNDSDGKPVESFQVNILNKINWTGWRDGKDGLASLYYVLIPLPGTDESNSAEILVRAEGYAPLVTPVAPLAYDGTATVQLEEARDVTIILRTADGSDVPDSVMPVVYFEHHKSLMRYECFRQNGKRRHEPSEFYPTTVKRMGPGVYTVVLSKWTPDFFVLLDDPPFIRGYQAGPFTEDDVERDQIEIPLPKTSTVHVTFGPPAGSTEIPYELTRLKVFREISEDEKPVQVADEIRDGTSAQHAFLGLIPGRYVFEFSTALRKDRDAIRVTSPDPAYFRDYRTVDLVGGDERTLDVEFAPFDDRKHVGDHAVTVQVIEPNEKPLRSVPYALIYNDAFYGRVPVQTGTLPADGRLEFTGLNGDKGAARYHGFGFVRNEPLPQFLLELANRKLGGCAIQLQPQAKHEEFEFTIAPHVGVEAPDITLIDVFSGEEVHLSDYRGKVVAIDFWATWCNFSQLELPLSHEMVSRRAKDWEGKVAILAISLDHFNNAVKAYAQREGLDGPTHLWAGPGTTGWKSPVARTYSINSLPSAILIDQSGNIIWRGESGISAAESMIDRLLAQE